MNTESPTPTDLESSRKRVQRLAWLFDEAIKIPGTRFSLGIDSLIGLIPGVGDLIGVLLGITVMYEGYRAGLPGSKLRKMLRNSVIDALGGLIPVIGDFFDVAFKSNSRNSQIILEHLDECERGSRAPPPTQGAGTPIVLWFAVLVATGAMIGGTALLVV